MNSMLKGAGKVFSFTLSQRMKKKGWLAGTIITAVLCFLIPAVIITLIQLYSDDDSAEPVVHTVQAIYVADTSENSLFDLSSLKSLSEFSGYSTAEYIQTDNTDDALLKASENTGKTLVLSISGSPENFLIDVILPENSDLTLDDAQAYSIFIDSAANSLKNLRTAVASDTPEVSDEDSDSEANPEDNIKNVLAYLLPYLNIMILYFLILFYGQGTASSILMEKSSKLMDTMLLSVRPEAMVVGKVLAQTVSCLIQVSLWLLGLAGGFFAGIRTAEALVPGRIPAIALIFTQINGLISIFSPVNFLFLLLFIAAGLVLYLALSSIGGALAGKQEDLSMTNVLFVFVLIISFFMVLSISLTNLDAVTVLDWLPTTSVLIAPSHIFLGTMSAGGAALSLLVVLAVAFIFMLIAGRIYRIMSMYKGKIPKPGQLVKMILTTK